MSPPFYGHLPQQGLHLLKDAWFQKSYLRQHSEQIAQHLEEAIDATFHAAQVRSGNFRLSRSPNQQMHETSRERRLEAAMLQRWTPPGLWPLPGGWNRLVAFQVPLYAQQERGQWGSIDLLGATADGLPVVVELKKSPASGPDGRTSRSETPLRIVLEGAAYAIALRKNWNQRWFREEWITRLRELKVDDLILERLPESLTTVPIVGAAPASYWLDWLPVTAKGRSELGPEVWNAFRSLLDELTKFQLPVTFVSVSGEAENPTQLAIQPLEFPPT
ncbi:MAG TPA: hypothetical protein VNQ76_02775 [Planctomicrobium sp.]|nr:hypothetical protein [Planctomicrobium sp.]